MRKRVFSCFFYIKGRIKICHLALKRANNLWGLHFSVIIYFNTDSNIIFFSMNVYFIMYIFFQCNHIIIKILCRLYFFIYITCYVYSIFIKINNSCVCVDSKASFISSKTVKNVCFSFTWHSHMHHFYDQIIVI